MLIGGSLGDLEGSEVSEKDPRGSDVPLSSIVCPPGSLLLHQIWFKTPHDSPTGLFTLAITQQTLFLAHLGTLKGPQYGIF